MTRIRVVLRHRDFRSLWLGGLISDAGDWLLLVALPIVVYRLTGSALGTSLAFLVELAPGILLAPLTGRLADRCDGRRVLPAISCLQALFLLPLLVVHGRAGLPVVYAVIGAQAVLAALFHPVKNALLPTLVPRADLVPANALTGLNENLGRLAGGPLGGVLLVLGGVPLIVAVDGVTFVLAALLIAGTRHGRPSRSGDIASGARRPRGFTGVLGDATVRHRLLVAAIAGAAQGIFVVLFVLFVAQSLHGGAGEIGLLRGVQAIGAIAAGLVLGARARRGSGQALTAWAAIAFGVIDLAIWNAPHLTTATPVYVVLFVAVGAPGIVMVTGMISALQEDTAAHERGRTFSALGLASNGGQAVGMVAAGLLAAPVGILFLLNAQGVLYLIAGGLAAKRVTPQRCARGSARPAEHRGTSSPTGPGARAGSAVPNSSARSLAG